MQLTEEQLKRWSHQGAVNTAKATADAIKDCLRSSSRLSGKDFEVYLQGSYKNDTNILGDSDVDIVAQLNSTIYPETSGLSPWEQLAIRFRLPAASYRWEHFRDDVYRALCDAYGAVNVIKSHNCIKLKEGSGRLPADVVPSILYRRYTASAMWVDGIYFYSPSSGGPVVNYPRQHYDNGVSKNLQTNGWYKPTVRMFKNARSYLVSRGAITQGLAPSYFLESLIYNVPDDRFGVNYMATYRAVVEWLRDTVDGTNTIVRRLSPPTCQNGQLPLFGTSPQQWNIGDAQRLVSELINLWNGRY